MFRPIIVSGVEEGKCDLSFRIDAIGEVVATTITAMTGKGKIVFGVVTAEGLRDEVVKGEK
jgi:hypothetical protein